MIKFYLRFENDKQYLVAEVNGKKYCRLKDPDRPFKEQCQEFMRQVAKFEKMDNMSFEEFMFRRLK